MAVAEKEKVEILEQGNIYFFYRPRVQENSPESLRDIQRLYLVLSPEGKKRFRMAVIGSKKLPKAQEKGRRYWGFIELVRGSPNFIREALSGDLYSTKTRGERSVPPARPAGEGVYRLLSHNDHTHLVYALELPRQQGEVQKELQIEPQASYIISIKNPDAPAAPAIGTRPSRQVHFPKYLQETFRGRRFSEANPPEFLDREGAEFVMIAAAEDVKEELGIELNSDEENAGSADMFRELELNREQHPVEPLFRGKWE
jgi:hypothetical protein